MSLKERFIFNFIESDRWKYLWDGLGATLQITFFSLILGVIIGVFIAIIRSTYDKNGKEMKGFGKLILTVLNLICRVYLTVIRGTPVVELRQSFLDDNNETKMINPQFAYVLPSGKEKVVKVLMQGYQHQLYDMY